MASVGQ
jgi:hypothetical protein